MPSTGKSHAAGWDRPPGAGRGGAAPPLRHARGSEGALSESGGHPAAAGPPGEPVAVLVVDDSTRVRRFLTSVLLEEGVEVEIAASAEEALEVLHDRVFLVITDLVMEGRSGLELLRVLRGLRPGLPVVCMSSDPVLLGHASRAGADAVLHKPVSAVDVRIVLRLLAPR